MVLQKPFGTTRLENAEIFRIVRKTTFSGSPPGQSLCQWRQKGVSRPNSGGVAANFHDAQLQNQTSDRLWIGGNLLVTNSSIDCESFISGLSSPLNQFYGCVYFKSGNCTIEHLLRNGSRGFIFKIKSPPPRPPPPPPTTLLPHIEVRFKWMWRDGAKFFTKTI